MSNTAFNPGQGPAGPGFVHGIVCFWPLTVATIPSGWLLCDGTSGTPDLRDVFLVGARSDSAGLPVTNLTGSLTASGGSISHHHADHSITQPAVSSHSITQPVVSSHAITQPVVSAHAITQPVVANHTYTTSAVRTSTASTAAAITAVSAHTLSTSVAIAAHTLSTNVTIADHTLSTSVAVADHTFTTSVGVSSHDTLSAPQPYKAGCWIMYN